MSRFASIFFLLLLAGPVIASPPPGMPVTIVGLFTKERVAGSLAYGFAGTWRAMWVDGEEGYKIDVSQSVIYPIDNGDGTYSLLFPDQYDPPVALEDVIGFRFLTLDAGSGSYICTVNGVESGVGTYAGPTVRLFVSGFAGGIVWLFVFWLLVGLVGMFRRAAWRFS